MEVFWKQLRTLSLPWTARLAAGALLVVAAAINVSLFVFGVRTLRVDIIAATLQFAGALLPLLLIAVVLIRSSSGVESLKHRTRTFFCAILPKVLHRLVEDNTGFYDPEHAKPPASDTRTAVLINLAREECCADFALGAPSGADSWRLLVFRLEVNVKRVNFNLCLPSSLVANASEQTAPDAFFKAFRHSLGGALAERKIEDGEEHEQTGYRFLADPLRRTIAGQDFTCLVGSKFVGQEFLWDSAEQLYFAQDLMFMLRAFMAEAPALFPAFSGRASEKAILSALAECGTP